MWSQANEDSLLWCAIVIFWILNRTAQGNSVWIHFRDSVCVILSQTETFRATTCRLQDWRQARVVILSREGVKMCQFHCIFIGECHLSWPAKPIHTAQATHMVIASFKLKQKSSFIFYFELGWWIATKYIHNGCSSSYRWLIFSRLSVELPLLSVEATAAESECCRTE